MAARKFKGRGAPGKPKSKKHREALSKALKAYHASRGSNISKRKTGSKTATRTRKYKNKSWNSLSATEKKKAARNKTSYN